MISISSYTIPMTLDNVINFLHSIQSGVPRDNALQLIARLIQEYLNTQIYIDDYFHVYSINDTAEMISLMLRGGTPRRGHYNPYYIMWKMRQVRHTRPHELTGQMKRFTSITVFNDHVDFEIPDHATTRTRRTRAGRVHVYNFGPIHERNKSVLKATMVFAWPHIRVGVTDTYAAEAYRFSS